MPPTKEIQMNETPRVGSMGVGGGERMAVEDPGRQGGRWSVVSGQRWDFAGGSEE